MKRRGRYGEYPCGAGVPDAPRWSLMVPSGSGTSERYFLHESAA